MKKYSFSLGCLYFPTGYAEINHKGKCSRCNQVCIDIYNQHGIIVIMLDNKNNSVPTKEDIGAAMMAWYAEAIKEYPEGLVTQAQVAEMLCISRMAVSRLVGRGYLRAVYFPAPPDIVGCAISQDDPTWVKVVGWLSIKMGDKDTYAFPKACYVSFADVVRLWVNGDAKKKCQRDWNEILTVANPLGLFSKKKEKEGADKLRAIRKEKRKIAELERNAEGL